MILIPTYNSAGFLDATLASAVNQTLPSSVIVVDNCSTDQTAEVVARFPTVELVRNAQNLGRIGNWNRCVELAIERAPRFFKILFAGDMLRPEAMERYNAIFAAHPELAMITSAYQIVSNGQVVETVAHLSRTERIDPERSQELGLSIGNWFASPSIQAFNTQRVGQVRFSEAFPWAADWKFCLDLTAKQPSYYLVETLAEFHMEFRKFYGAEATKLRSTAEWFYLTSMLLETRRPHLPPEAIVAYERMIKRKLFRAVRMRELPSFLVGRFRDALVRR